MRNHTIFAQLMLFFFIVFLIPLMIISIVISVSISKQTERSLDNTYMQMAEQYDSNIEEQLFEYEDRLSEIANNTIILDTLTGHDTNPYIGGVNVTTEITKIMRPETSRYIRECMIYTNRYDNKKADIYGKNVTTVEEARKEYWYTKEKKLTDNTFYYDTLRGKPVLSLVKEIIYVDTGTYDRYDVGYTKLDISADSLFAVSGDEKGSAYETVVTDMNGNVIYSSDPELNKITEGMKVSDKMRRVNNSAKITYCKRIDKVNLKIFCIFDRRTVIREEASARDIVLMIIFIVAAASTGLAYIYSRIFAGRVGKLLTKIQNVENGDFTVGEPIEGKDEIAMLDQQFTHMVIKLDKLVKKNYIQKLENKETELRNLQLQINPHFLYNTLETISSLAAVNNMFEISTLCEKLGDIFRYSLGKNAGEFVTVRQELANTMNYVYIQKVRFGQKFEVFTSIDQQAENFQMLRFVLQPIVENAILHGLDKKTEKGTLEITIAADGQFLVINVMDDGIGMSGERVEELSDFINSENISGKEKTGSIGIRNVNQRIKMVCGQMYGISIESVLGHGSNFIVKLPVISYGKQVVSGSDGGSKL